MARKKSGSGTREASGKGHGGEVEDSAELAEWESRISKAKKLPVDLSRRLIACIREWRDIGQKYAVRGKSDVPRDQNAAQAAKLRVKEQLAELVRTKFAPWCVEYVRYVRAEKFFAGDWPKWDYIAHPEDGDWIERMTGTSNPVEAGERFIIWTARACDPEGLNRGPQYPDRFYRWVMRFWYTVDPPQDGHCLVRGVNQILWCVVARVAPAKRTKAKISPNPRGRKPKYPPDEDEKLVANWRSTGLPKKEFAHRKGISSRDITLAQSRIRARNLKKSRSN